MSEIVVAGEALRLLPERAVLWPVRSVLFVADVHLGKAAAIRHGGRMMPAESNADDLPALTALIERERPTTLVVLGDLWHARSGRTPDEMFSFEAWCEWHRGTEMILVEGNHDARSGRLPDGCGVRQTAEGEVMGPFVLQHHPEPDPRGYVLAGHVHPGAVLGGRGGQRLKLPCFLFGEEVGILPAFGSLTGCAAVRPRRGDRVSVIADGRVLSIT